MEVKKDYNFDDAIDFIFNGNQSDLSGLSLDEEENNEIEDTVQNSISNDEPTDAGESDVNITLASLAGASNQASSNNQGQANNEPAQCVYLWRKRNMVVHDHSFLEEFSEPLLENMIPLQYFLKFITTALLDIVVEQTNIYSFQTIHKSINTCRNNVFDWTRMKMGILQLPSYKSNRSENFVVQE